MDTPHRSRHEGIREAGASGAHHDLSDESEFDALLACLEYICVHHGRPFSKAAVLSQLPLSSDGRLTPQLVLRAAPIVGLKAKIIKRRPSDVPALLTPFIVLFADGAAAVARTKNVRKKRVELVFPAVSNSVRRVTLAALDGEALDFVILVSPDETAVEVERGTDTRRGHWFWSEIGQFWPAWLQIVAAAMLINVLGLAFPLFVMNVYDRVIPNFSISTLWALTVGILIVVVFEFALRQLRALALDEAGRRIDIKIGAVLFQHALAISMKNRRLDSGAMANQMREFDTVRDFFTSSSIIALSDLLFIGIFIFVLEMVVGSIALVPLVAVPIVIGVTLLVQYPLSRAVRVTARQASRRHSLLIDSLSNIETVKATGAESALQRLWEEATAANARASTSTRMWSSLALYFTGAVQQLVGIAVLVWGVFLVADAKITIGGLIAASLLSGRILGPLGNIAMTVARAQQAFAAMRAISEMIKLKPDRAYSTRSGQLISRGDIEFKAVHFTYPDASMQALSNVSFKVGAGERVAVLGKVGSGKSTIGKLLASLYIAEKGQVLIDGADIRHFDPADVRRAIGYVSQEAELFAGTLRDNILLGAPRATENEIEAAVYAAGVDAFTRTHPLGLARMVGERGRGLSGGQRQAVALARSLLRRPRVLFLDEPSGAMDANTENDLLRRLAEWCNSGTTLVLCSHRSSMLSLVDRLLVLDAGTIVADGPKADVLQLIGANLSQPRGMTT